MTPDVALGFKSAPNATAIKEGWRLEETEEGGNWLSQVWVNPQYYGFDFPYTVQIDASSLYGRLYFNTLQIDASSLYRCLSFNNETYFVGKKRNALAEDKNEELEQEIVVRMPPKRSHTVGLRIRAIRRAEPKVVLPEDSLP